MGGSLNQVGQMNKCFRGFNQIHLQRVYEMPRYGRPAGVWLPNT